MQKLDISFYKLRKIEECLLDRIKYKMNDIDVKNTIALIKSSKLQVIEYYKDNGLGWDDRTCYEAAKKGDLDCLQFAHENECKWDKETCQIAAKKGDLDCLKYLHKNGCPWDKWT